MENMKRVDLYGIMGEIEKNTVVLPDFQRGFAWRDKNKQISLIASVLTKLPIGTVLFLDVESGEYGYKKIGKNERNILSPQQRRPMKALLDGQQRITTLMAYFSTKLQEGQKDDLISNTLNRRYFLNLPSFHSVMSGAEDIFGGSLLRLPASLENGNYPEISSEDMCSCLTFVTEEKDFLYKDVMDLNTKNICDYCRNTENSGDGASYLVPLYYLLGACDRDSRENLILKDVIRVIGEEYKNSILTWFQDDRHSVQEKKCFLEKLRVRDCTREEIVRSLYAEDILSVKERLGEELSEKKGSWISDFMNYLLSCIKEIGLYEIKVEAKDKERAIDIYENLNLGGKALSVFDLVLAKSSKCTDGNKRENLMTRIVDYIEEDHREDYAPFIEKCERRHKNSYKNNIEEKKLPYSASERIGCWDKGKKELSPGYIKALMNLLGIVNHFSGKSEILELENQERIRSVNTQIMKKAYLLNKIPALKMNDYVKEACRGLDRAAVFLQVRCGIRGISEIHYNLMWAVLGTVFLKEEWFWNEDVLDYMEAWYWSAILSGAFKIEQNRAFIENLRNVLSEVRTLGSSAEDKRFVTRLCKEVLKDQKFADKDILLMNNPSVYPEEVIENTICQYYLANIYKDILREIPGQKEYVPKEMEALNADLKLEKHHLVPIGGMNARYRDVKRKTAERRKDRNDPYNSPLNFLLISKQANAVISNNLLKSYIEYCDKDTLKSVGIVEWESLEKKSENIGFQIGDEELKLFLEKRYDNFEHSLNERLKALLNCGDIKYEKTEC